MTRPSLEERFWSKVELGPDCWLWVGAVHGNGYGGIKIAGRMVGAHVVAFTLGAGREPIGKILHDCGTPLCVRFAHLYEGDDEQNARDRDRHGRTARGERNGNHRLTEQQVRDLRRQRAAGRRQADLAREFGISRAMVSFICRNLYWKDVD